MQLQIPGAGHQCAPGLRERIHIETRKTDAHKTKGRRDIQRHQTERNAGFARQQYEQTTDELTGYDKQHTRQYQQPDVTTQRYTEQSEQNGMSEPDLVRTAYIGQRLQYTSSRPPPSRCNSRKPTDWCILRPNRVNRRRHDEDLQNGRNECCQQKMYIVQRRIEQRTLPYRDRGQQCLSDLGRLTAVR